MRITKLSPSQRKEGRWLVWLEDGSLLRVGEAEVVSFGLCQGMELSGEKRAELTASASMSAMKEKALRALTVRPMSRKELIDKLTAPSRRPPRGAEEAGEEAEEAVSPAAMAETVADRMEELGLLNDGEYALQVARSCAAKGYGSYRVKEELRRRGVPRELWDSALETLDDPGDTLDALLAKKLRGWSGDRRELKRAADFLARRGFGWEEISAALSRYEQQLEN